MTKSRKISRHRLVHKCMSTVAGITGVCAATLSAQSPNSSVGKSSDLQILAIKTGKLLEQTLDGLTAKESDKDPSYYDAGIWHTKEDADPRVSIRAAGTCATLWRWTGNPLSNTPDTPEAKSRREKLRQMIIETVDRQIKDHVTPEGEFAPGGTTTHFAAMSLGVATNEMKDSLDAATLARWRTALTAMVEHLIKTNDLPTPEAKGWKATDGWYANGNIELGEADLLYLTWQATGEQRYKDLFELQWNHTVNPDQQRWGRLGYGLFYIKKPERPDGSDGSGYLAEAEQDPGFDRDYTHYSLSVASRLYVESKDPRVLRLVNLLLNSLMPYVNKETWMLDATYGSRHSTHFPMFSCGLPIAALAGGRADLRDLVDAQFEKGIAGVWKDNPARGLSDDGAVILDAAMSEDRATAPKTASTSAPTR